VFPKQLLLSILPQEVDILCTHPMFGPDSGRGSWQGLNFMYEVVRCGDDPRRQARVESFVKVHAIGKVAIGSAWTYMPPQALSC
jgi:prephenate dehydrogenase